MPESPGDWRSRTDHHASRYRLHPAERLPAEMYYDPDPDLDEFCPGCTPALIPDPADDSGRRVMPVHDSACVFARRARTA